MKFAAMSLASNQKVAMAYPVVGGKKGGQHKHLPTFSTENEVRRMNDNQSGPGVSVASLGRFIFQNSTQRK